MSSAASHKAIWEKESFIRRQWELRSNDLASFYPSQAWCVYRILPQCDSVLDVGFGSAHTAAKVHTITPIDYFGVDSSKEVIALAKPHENERTKFIYGDILEAPLDRRFDAVMGWSLTYALGDPYGSITKMWDATDKYLMFDVRAVHGNDDIIDMEKSYGTHDGERCHYSIFSWPKLCDFLSKLNPAPVNVEFCTYYFPPSKNVHLHESVPQPFVASIVVHKVGEKKEPLMRGSMVATID